ncbi:M16 family metallopeptidase [Inconstantimicrobium mannanitabidum]|uniref:Peptidase M16 n=1 Tax=Inconstantimicrobium mannanitabidum TaxID=1604901 RepID=A0ACB5R992_9CLOT|nr:pitrilysin family protein [Clostridium sp. TW13]GKX65439.1 peptidase M16 [Clostridium sp. TW13]
MKEYILQNGIKLIYKNIPGAITSFCIGFEAGANMEKPSEIGVAHALEHMVFKGTSTKSEDEINEQCDELFAFNNAMTNFPYVIYYGVCDKLDFNKAFSLYSDILVAPIFNSGFNEEIDVICTESREWKEDLEQYCEDVLFYNSFDKRRIKHTIIGSEEQVKKITLEEVKAFYNRYYIGSNCTVTVVTSIDEEAVRKIVEGNMGILPRGSKMVNGVIYEELTQGAFEVMVPGFTGAKIEYAFDISELNSDEIEVLNLFNLWFSEGVSSLLYNELRTKKGLVYDVSATVKNEKGIKLFVINASTSKDKIGEVKNIIDMIINRLRSKDVDISKEQWVKLQKRLKRKRNLDVERGIILAVRLTTYSIMYGEGKRLIDELEGNFNLDFEQMTDVVCKIFSKASSQIIV